MKDNLKKELEMAMEFGFRILMMKTVINMKVSIEMA
jgi:hypothetical protein